MNILSKQDDLRTLMQPHAGPCVSSFVPMERAGKETRQNSIRFKNALRLAEERLVGEGGISEEEARSLLKPLQPMLDDELFWQHQSDGLAVFRAAEATYIYRLPLDFEELVVVSDRFHLKPLLPLFTNNGHFYVLALSQNDVRLLHATRYTIEEVALPEETPRSLEAALAQDDPEKQLVRHPNTASRAGSDQAPVYHGHSDPDERVNLLRFFLEVDRGVWEVLKEKQAPLVLAGVEELLPYYHERNSYSNLLEEGATGNFDHASDADLHGAAWTVVEPYMQREQQAAREQYHESASAERASSDLSEVVAAAAYGRVDRLFVALNTQHWGQFDMQASKVVSHAERQPGDEDLLDLAACQTLLNSGTVYAVEPDTVPEGSELAAIFRY